MTCKHLVIAIVFASVAASAQTATPEQPSKNRDNAVWVQPLGTAVLGLGSSTLHLPFGTYFKLGAGGTFTAELAITWAGPGAGGFEDAAGYWQVGGSVGRLFALGSDDPLNGFFVQPKLQMLTSRDLGVLGPPPAPARQGPSTGFEVQLAADVGYQRHFGAFFIGAGLGVGIGYGFNITSAGIWSAALAPSLLGGSTPSNHVTVSLNLNLLRIGFAI